MEQTIDAIIDASYLPLSIVIVGVGNADFSSMDALDSDKQLLTYRGKKAERDIVQFVPFRNYRQQHYSALARDVCAEIPAQVRVVECIHKSVSWWHIIKREILFHLFRKECKLGGNKCVS